MKIQHSKQIRLRFYVKPMRESHGEEREGIHYFLCVIEGVYSIFPFFFFLPLFSSLALFISSLLCCNGWNRFFCVIHDLLLRPFISVRIDTLFVGISMPGYPPPFVIVLAEIGEVPRTWGILWQCNCAGNPDLLLLSCVQ